MFQVNYDTNSSTNPLAVAVTGNIALANNSIRYYEDPVGKQRMSAPQALIDTDFEYSVQPSKWEFLNLVQNRPSVFVKNTGGNSIDLTGASINGGNQVRYSTMTVTTTVPHGFAVGDVVVVQYTTNQLADGTFLVTSVASTTVFTYLARGQVSGAVIDGTATIVYGGGLYANCDIVMSSVVGNGASPSVLTVNTASAHALLPGTAILINNMTTAAANGAWVILTVENPTRFTFSCATNAVTTVTIGSGKLFVSPEGYLQHRSTDGGVSITTGENTMGGQLIRQTRRYFRYQSGKGVQFSTGLKLTPTFDIDTISASGATATCTTQQYHSLQPGSTVQIEGVEVAYGTTNPYNGTFIVDSIVSTTAFTYSMPTVPITTSPIPDNAYATCTKWTGGTVRSGLFDSQSGFYFEYDGNTLFAVRRNSIKELAGKVSVNVNSNLVTGSSTRFLSQLLVNDHIVIRGQTYEVSQITSDTSMLITPQYRGSTNVTNARYNKTHNTKFPQSTWNLDTCDGTGASGYAIDISKMQMAFIDYSWYGAGTIRWGFRTTNGDITYCHRLPMNNVNFAAYMRSGNLPGRYEVMNYGYFSKLVGGGSGVRGAAFASGDQTMYVADATYWPYSGYAFLQDGTNCELVQYTAVGAYNSVVGGYPISGLTRRANYHVAGVSVLGAFSSSAYSVSGGTGTYTFTPDTSVGGIGTSQVSVQSIRNTCAPMVSHWGVSVIMDGGYDDDKSFIFTVGMQRRLAITPGAQRPMLAIRIAPSVDSGNGQNFGNRELINRMQLTLRALGVTSSGQFLIEGILNPAALSGTGITLPASWTTVKVGAGSLAQVCYFDSTGVYGATASNATGVVTGGDRIFGFYAELGTGFAITTADLTNVRDLGTSILSGDGVNTAPGFPNGPDVLVITATNIAVSGTGNIACRLSWTEAQA
jgi:hypothetical protein